MYAITISGGARAGKTTMGHELKKQLEEKGYHPVVAQYGDFLKMILKNYYGWDGAKDPRGRSLLQSVGTDVFRKNQPDIWVNMMIEFIRGLGDTKDVIIIPDTRFRNEIVKLIDSSYITDVLTVKIERSNYDDGLTEEQRAHSSERALDDYNFEMIVKNDGTLEDYLAKAKQICEYFIRTRGRQAYII